MFYDESDDDFGIPIERPPSRPMVNFPKDTENEDDYVIGWEWHEVDPGLLIGPYNGFWQCLLDPMTNTPEDFFNALFERRMYTIMAEKTNKYAQRIKEEDKHVSTPFYRNFIYKILAKTVQNITSYKR